MDPELSKLSFVGSNILTVFFKNQFSQIKSSIKAIDIKFDINNIVFLLKVDTFK
jgi:hypothetical protein